MHISPGSLWSYSWKNIVIILMTLVSLLGYYVFHISQCIVQILL
ncbi:hypothetical protein SAMN04490355_100649 [Pelosinus propionicus DSM 13327]|uniref:Uncharacterized protein n=1 Tax=Pelosinus propionicus DSM 13327 TaxID=1123291 RepID=A0A1I4I1V3_9FIRM|nr:hypothetical protein SAMN04490355_100649 [Pelosinus propionicus DSM 13327]